MRRPMRLGSTGEREKQEALAALIRNTRTTARSLSLIEVERWLATAIRQVGGLAAVAELVGLSSKMLRQFQSVNRLSAPVRQIFQSRRIDSVDAAVHLSKMPSRKQLPVARELASGAINTVDLRVIAEILVRNPRMGAGTAIENVKATRNVMHHVAEFVIRGSGVDNAVLKRRFDDALGKQNVVSVNEKEGIGRLVLTSPGKRALIKMCRESGRTKARTIVAIAEGDARW